MAKLYFRYGTVGSAKTLNLLAVAHNYRQQGKKVILLKPALDARFGQKAIRSRAGLESQADILLSEKTLLNFRTLEGASCLLVDEAQFLSPFVVDQLRRVASELEIPVICYGLRSDFKSHLFDGSRRLLELADSIEEIKTTCAFCNRKAIMNLKHVGGKVVTSGPSLDLGAEEKYLPACYSCYSREISQGGLAQGEKLPMNA